MALNFHANPEVPSVGEKKNKQIQCNKTKSSFLSIKNYFIKENKYFEVDMRRD